MRFKDNVPIYLQIEQYLYRQIALGRLKPGQKMSAVRKLAAQLTVNTNTVQRALRELNSEGVIFTKRGEGSFISEDENLLRETRKRLIDEKLTAFVHDMTALGVNREHILTLLKKFIAEEDKK